MEIGSIVETVGNFETERKNWGLPYPKTGDVITVMAITKHPKKDNLIAAIDLAKLCKDFADKGQMDEAMNIESEQWVVVISELEGMSLNCA